MSSLSDTNILEQQNTNFDHSAASYDNSFTHTAIGEMQRKQVYRLLEENAFFSNTKVFEINCGTGYDAEQFTNKAQEVFATDISEGMIREAKEKRNPKISFESMDCQYAHLHPEFSKSDVLFSNFGGLNCLSHKELESFVENISSKQSSGGQIAWVIMPKKCMMESLYFLSKGKFSKVFRRNTKEALMVNVDGVDIATYYHSPKSLRKMLHKYYEIELIQTVAFFIPPSYMENLFGKRKALLNSFYKIDRYLGTLLPAAWSDHFIVIAKRRLN